MNAVRRTFAAIGRHEMAVLVLMLLTAASLWGFVSLADMVMEGDTEAFDRALLLALRNPADLGDPIGPGWLEELGRDFTALGGVGFLTMLTFVVAGYLFMIGKARTCVLLAASVGGGLLLSTLLKMGFDRARPDLVPHGSIVYTASFPSGHSMLSAVVYLTLGALLARISGQRRVKAYFLVVAVLLTLLVGISRVYLGVHWPTDVLAGWTAGAGWALMVWAVARWLQRKGTVEQESGAEDAP